MASAADTSRKNNETPATGEKKRRSPIVLTALIAVVAAAVTGAGVWYYTQHMASDSTETAKPKTPPPAQYLALDPAFVVNLPYTYDGPRYLQVEVQLVTRKPESVEKLKANIPAIRARLLLFFSQTDTSQISDRAALEKLQLAALDEVNALMLTETGEKPADALLFTSFVTQ